MIFGNAVFALLTGFLIYCAMALSIILTIQSVYTLYIMLYTWDRPEASRIAKAPTRFRAHHWVETNSTKTQRHR